MAPPAMRKPKMTAPYDYQQTGRYYAMLAPGLEESGAEELAELGADRIESDPRGASFAADPATLCRINYRTRLTSRLLAPLVTFRCNNDRELYGRTQRIDWSALFGPEQTFALFANVTNSRITHSRYALQVVKDAIVDQFREKFGRRPSVDRDQPYLWLGLHINKNRAVISLDTGGGPLHKRGYRSRTVAAPMQETLAAAIVRFSGWTGQRPLYDPMCGSGTLLCEAVMHACRIPAGRLRQHWGIERLPDYDASLWGSVRRKADGEIRPLPEGLIAGGDVSGEAVDATGVNLRRLGFEGRVAVRVQSYDRIDKLENRTILVNPPYGIRLQDEQIDTPAFYKQFGDFLKQRCNGSEALVFFGDRQHLKHIGLRTSFRKPLRQGGLDARLCKFELY